MDKKSKDEPKIKLSGLLPELNERQRRLLVGAEAHSVGYGGINILSEITGITSPTIRRGIRELNNRDPEVKNFRRPGGGRKRTKEKFPGLVSALEEIVEPEIRGDPETPHWWTCKSVRNIADLLNKQWPPCFMNLSLPCRAIEKPRKVLTILIETNSIYILTGRQRFF